MRPKKSREVIHTMKVMKHRRGLSAVLAGLFLVGCLPVYGLGAGTGETTTAGSTRYAADSITGTPLVTPECQVSVSSGDTTAHYAVDGITNETYQWASDDMKTSNATPTDEQIVDGISRLGDLTKKMF